MLAKKYRLPVDTFPLRAKTLYRGQRLTVKTNINNLSYNRVGVIVTKKAAPKAVERNRLRRKILSGFTLPSFAPQNLGGQDLLILIKPIKLDRDAEEKLFKELNLIKQKLIK